MSEVKTITVTSTEQEITLDATYQFMWFRNLGDNDCYVSDHSGIIAGDDNVTLVKAGESGRIATSGRAVYIKAVSGTSAGEIHAQNFSDCPFRNKAKGSGQTITVEPLTVTENGVYTAPTGKAYSPVSVDVQEQPWQPLEDGYSNFWFELTNDTLSPWLNFSAKTENAVIDWGDGSGEVSLDTLTPTHTYSKAGKYVVKVKGVTGIAKQHTAPYTEYINVLKNVELNNEVNSYLSSTFTYCTELENFVAYSLTYAYEMFRFCGNLKTISATNVTGDVSWYVIQYCFKLKNFPIPTNCTSIGNSSIYYAFNLLNLTIPATLTTIGNYGFVNSIRLNEIHFLSTVPATLGTSVFSGLPSDFIIYVPVGYGDTYKQAEGWSSYADHILEEGQTPNRAMLAKFNSAKTDEPQDDMR